MALIYQSILDQHPCIHLMMVNQQDSFISCFQTHYFMRQSFLLVDFHWLDLNTFWIWLNYIKSVDLINSKQSFLIWCIFLDLYQFIVFTLILPVSYCFENLLNLYLGDFNHSVHFNCRKLNDLLLQMCQFSGLTWIHFTK